MTYMNLDYQLYRAKYRWGQYLPLKTPVDVSLELASQCNMKCSYCYHSSSDVPFAKGIMHYNTAAQILYAAEAMSVNSLKMNWKGESSINPRFRDILKLAKSLARNSTFIDRVSNSNFKFRSDREDIFEGFSYQTKVKVSYDSFQKEVFETNRAGGDHALTSRNIDIFYNHPLRIKSDTRLVIQAVRTKLNKHEDIAFEVKRRWPDASVSIREVVEGRVEKDLSEFVNEHRDFSNRQPCKQAFVRIIFNWEGMAFPCCPVIDESLPLGSIRRTSLYNIFNGARARQLREDLKSGAAFKKYSSCKNCSSFESFKGSHVPWNS